MDQCFSILNNGCVLPFNNPILLGIIGYNELPLDSCILAEIVEVLGVIFSSIIWYEDFDLPACQVFNLSLEFLELGEDFIFSLQEVDPRLPWEVINEGGEVKISSQGWHRHRSTNIWVDKIQNSLRSTITGWKWMLGIIPKCTSPTYPFMLIRKSETYEIICLKYGRDL